MFILHPSSFILRRRRPAFTLVEMLTVIIIIGILMAILVPAVMSTRIKALDGRVASEITQLESAVKAYKEKNGGHPPTMWQEPADVAPANERTAMLNRFIAHFRKVFPRANFPTGIAAFQTGLLEITDNNAATNPAYPACSSPGYNGGTGLDIYNLDPPEALVLWLGGLPAQHDDVADPANWEGSTKVTGFNLNPADPLRPRTPAGGQRSTSLFEFIPVRLRDLDTDGWLEYYPDNQELPYVYFDSISYNSQPFNGSATIGMARPYVDGTNIAAFMNQATFQILSAGLDNNYGMDNPAKQFPLTSSNSNQFDLDNLSNFTRGRLEDAQ